MWTSWPVQPTWTKPRRSYSFLAGLMSKTSDRVGRPRWSARVSSSDSTAVPMPWPWYGGSIAMRCSSTASACQVKSSTPMRLPCRSMTDTRAASNHAAWKAACTLSSQGP